MTTGNGQLDLAFLRAKLTDRRGQLYWRSLEELAATDGFQEFLYREFPQQSDRWTDPIGRRRFLHLMGASLALAGLAGCTKQPAEPIMPYVTAPEGIIPGKPLFFATAALLSGLAEGVLVENHMGRPTKVEGNPEHPASLGATDVFAQASILTLYDPDRSQTITQFGEIRSWSAFLSEMREAVQRFKQNKGSGLRILTETVTSPTLASQLQKLLSDYPSAKWHQYEPVGRDPARAGARLAFGTDVATRYHLEKADVVLSLDADFLSTGPGKLRYVRDFTTRRKVHQSQREMNRLYVLESTPSNTGAMADHRLPLKASEVEGFALALAAELGIAWRIEKPANLTGSTWVGPLARDLKRHPGATIVIPGEHQPPLVHALAHAMNHTLGNVGSTVIYTEPVEANPVDQLESLRELERDMQSGSVETLLILGGNPVFAAPVDIPFADALAKVKQRVYLGLYNDETSELCHWHIPQAHFLESWADARAYDGTVTILQPLIAPLYDGKTAHELMAAFTDQPEQSSYECIRQYWNSQFASTPVMVPGARASAAVSQRASGDFEEFWRKSLHDGFVANSALPAKPVVLAAQPAMLQTGRHRARTRADLSAGSARLRRTVRQQWLAAGAAEAAHAPHLGQRGADQPGHRTADGLDQRRTCGIEIPRPPCSSPSLDSSRSSRRLSDNSSGLWPETYGPRWHGCRVQCVCGSTLWSGLVWFRLGAQQDWTPLSLGLHSASSQHGGTATGSGRNSRGLSPGSRFRA